jgi:hypothetical protein
MLIRCHNRSSQKCIEIRRKTIADFYQKTRFVTQDDGLQWVTVKFKALKRRFIIGSGRFTPSDQRSEYVKSNHTEIEPLQKSRQHTSQTIRCAGDRHQYRS